MAAAGWGGLTWGGGRLAWQVGHADAQHGRPRGVQDTRRHVAGRVRRAVLERAPANDVAKRVFGYDHPDPEMYVSQNWRRNDAQYAE